MTTPAYTLYRPTLHQVRVFNLDPVDPPVMLAVLRTAVEHVAQVLAPEAATALRDQVAPSRQLSLQPRDVRYPLVRSTSLYPVLNQAPLHAALLAYQDGSSLLLHCIWHWDGEGDEETIRRLLTRRWSGPSEGVTGDRGESLLLTTVPLAGKECGSTHAAALFGLIAPPTEMPLLPLTLDGATLYVQQWQLPELQARWPALLLFHDREAEASAAADRLVTVDWPLVALYHLRLEHCLQDYRERVAPEIQRRMEVMSTALAQVFTPSGTNQQPPRVLTTADPNRLQDAVERLAEPQYALLETLGEAESVQHYVRRELENMQRRIAQLPMIASATAMAPGTTADTLQAALAGRAQHGLRQIEADVAQVQHQAERRTARAVEVLRTRTEIIDTLYDRLRNWVIGLLGVLLTLGQVLDKDVAKLLYTDFGVGRVWEYLGGMPLSQAQDRVLLYIRLLSIVTLTLLIAALIALWMRWHKWWKARRH
jgi:hypothetical protein